MPSTLNIEEISWIFSNLQAVEEVRGRRYGEVQLSFLALLEESVQVGVLAQERFYGEDVYLKLDGREVNRTHRKNSREHNTWVCTVEMTLVDTLKIAFAPSTHFTSAPFCKIQDDTLSIHLSHCVSLNTSFSLNECLHYSSCFILIFMSPHSPWCCWHPCSPSNQVEG